MTTRAPPEWEATARVARLNPPAMFAVAPSRLFDAGEGLFARRPIRRGTLVRLDTRPSDPHRPMEFEWDHLDFFIPVLSDGASPCVVNGQLSDIRTARRVCSVVQAPAYVRAPDDPLMKANDRGWRAGAPNTAQTYHDRARENAFEFVLSVDARGVNGVYAYFTRDVRVGDEIGCTYGWDYWRRN
jgi:hypothetical protein